MAKVLVVEDEPAIAESLAYSLRRALPYVPTPVAVGELLFLFRDDGVVSCVRAASGEEVWRERVEGVRDFARLGISHLQVVVFPTRLLEPFSPSR